jgi:uncharacterized membrane protein
MNQTPDTSNHHLRFHSKSHHLSSAFGNDSFGARAEAFARLFGTPKFLIAQSTIVGAWIAINAFGVVKFDLYPFILLNLAFSLQAAYAAPLILLAQTRQADRDKAGAENDALHREDLAKSSAEQLSLIVDLVNKNTELTEMTHKLAQRIEDLTARIHRHIGDESPATKSGAA